MVTGIPGNGIVAVADDEFQTQAAIVAEKFADFKQTASILIAGKVSDAEIRQARQAILEKSNELRNLSNGLVTIYSNIAAQNKTAVNWILIFSALIVALIMTAIVWVLGVSVAKPLSKMSGTLNLLADGDLSVNFDGSQKNQEMQELSANLNKVARSFSGAIHQMLALSDNIINSTTTSQQKVGQLVQMSVELSDQSNSVATSAEELTATTDEIAKSAENAAASAREADTAGDDGKKVVNHTMTSINNLA